MPLSSEKARELGKKGGRKKGTKLPHTLEREKVMEEIRARVRRTAQVLLDAQYSIARGQQFLYKVTQYKSGQKSKPELITSEYTIRAYLNGELDNEENEYYFITTKEPVNQAIDSLLDRTFGKAVLNIDHTSGGKALPTPIYGGQSTKPPEEEEQNDASGSN